MRKFFALMFAGILTGLGLLLAPATQAAPVKTDCKKLHTVSYSTGKVTVDMTKLRKCYGSDAQMIVGFTDVDGKPDGAKRYRVQLDLP